MHTPTSFPPLRFLLLTLLTLLQPTSPSPNPCPTPQTSTFTFRSITYLRYEVSGPATSPQPNTTQLVFELENGATGVSTGCACQNVMGAGGSWVDDRETWYACLDRVVGSTLGDGVGLGVDGGVRGEVRDESQSLSRTVVKTSARIDWDAWRVAVNQTWACGESTTISQFSALTLAPTCTESRTGSQYIKECTAPDAVVSATSYDDSI